ncbi:MAG: type I glutamate--ammonia ligase [Myxococcota bacterium]
MDARQVLEFAKEKGVVIVDCKFVDLLGTWQHCSFPLHQLEESTFEDGYGFDGSSIRGWQNIASSDMLMVPDASTAILDPFCEHPTLSLICDIVDPVTREPYAKDPRGVARAAADYVSSTGIGDTIFFGPEAEFFIFNSVRFDDASGHSVYHVDSDEAVWTSGRAEDRAGANLGYKPRHKEGYFPVPPVDSLQDLRTEMVQVMEECGITIEAHHHEVATAGQGEIDMKFSPMVDMADQLMLYKYIVKNVAVQAGMTATFMPKPIFDDNGSGMHCHQSIWRDGKPLFAGDQYAGLSEIGLHYTGGILKHARAIAAFSNPTTNSYKRLVPGFEAPVTLAYSGRNRSAACRIPLYFDNPKAKRIEVRFPDPSCNPYLTFAAMTMAGIDGIENKIDPGDPLDTDIYALSAEELAKVPVMPGSLEEALECLEDDLDFLLKGNVFSEDLLRSYVDYKRENEVDPLRSRPHPHEFALYYDI